MAKLWLIRHAVAAAPGDLRLPGIDHPLRPEGRAQARAAAARLRALAPPVVYASNALRARQTAEVIAAACGVPLVVDPALREVDFGAWGGRSYAEIVAADPAAASYFADPSAMTPPGGETAESAARRVHDLLEAVGTGDGGVIVGHAGSLRLALALALGMPLAAFWRLRLDCAHLSVLDWTAEGPIVECLNDGCHLGAAASDAEVRQ
jgi:ribonuclease H / adenosylcobalamin/alpha-ribazole phosphatase